MVVSTMHTCHRIDLPIHTSQPIVRLFAAICAVSAVKVSISMTPAVFLGAVLSPMPCLVLQASSSRSWKISVAVNADKAPPAAAFNSCPIMGTQPKHEDLGLMPLGYLMMWARSK